MRKVTAKDDIFVLSKHHFDIIKEAEDKVNGWFTSGDLKKGTRLYRAVESYGMRIKFNKIHETKV